MISIVGIDGTLRILDGYYNQPATTPDMASLYSKLATIELCGWIEVSMDTIAQDYIDRAIRNNDLKRAFAEIKKMNNGFRWEENFRKMLLPALGMANIELMLSLMGPTIGILDGELMYLHGKRNDAAHTNYDSTKTYDAPSVILNKFRRIYPILIDIESIVSRTT